MTKFNMPKMQHLRPLLCRTRQQPYRYRHFASIDKSDPPEEESPSKKPTINRPMYVPEPPKTIDDISEPTNCCMSGCTNCVWIQHAEMLSSVLKDYSKADVQKIIMDKVQDPNMRAFLSMELRIRKLID